MARVTPSEYADKWGRRLKASTPDITKGIDRVTEAPGIKAAKAADLMLSKVTEAITNGTFASQVAAVPLEEWKRKAKEKGIGRISQGVDSALPTQTSMAERLLAAVDAAAAKANSIPKGDLEASVARASTFIREMAARKLRKPAGR